MRLAAYLENDKPSDEGKVALHFLFEKSLRPYNRTKAFLYRRCKSNNKSNKAHNQYNCGSGIREADYAALILFADYFQVSLDYLLERTDNPQMLK